MKPVTKCKSKNTRKDYDFPETMEVCKDCGCDWVTGKNGSFFEITLNPREIKNEKEK